MCQQTKGKADIRSLPNIVTGTKVPPRCLRSISMVLLTGIKNHHSQHFSHSKPNHIIHCQFQHQNFTTMPKTLSESQQMLVESLFKTKTSQREITKHAHCSIPQIKKMKKIYHAFGMTVAPKIMKRGKPCALT